MPDPWTGNLGALLRRAFEVMIPSVLASAQIVASYAAVTPSAPVPTAVGAMAPAPFTAVAAKQTQTDTPKVGTATPAPKLKFVESGYFDLGYEKLLGVFSDEIIHGGVRYGQDDVTAFVRNSSLDTRGTGLPYPQSVTGTTIGFEVRHWFPKNQMFATFQMGDIVGGPNKGKTDTRYGLVGYTNWVHESWFSDVYGELFYLPIAGDTFFDIRFRSGKTLAKDKDGNYFWVYAVGQGWAAGQASSGTENRVEAGPGIAYVYRKLALSVNLEMRGGYSFRGPIPNPLYFNPTLIVSAGFDK